MNVRLLLVCALALSSCATPAVKPDPAPPSVVALPRARLAPPDAEMMVPREPDFLQKVLNFWSVKPAAPIPSSASSPSVKPES